MTVNCKINQNSKALQNSNTEEINNVELKMNHVPSKNKITQINGSNSCEGTRNVIDKQNCNEKSLVEETIYRKTSFKNEEQPTTLDDVDFKIGTNIFEQTQEPRIRRRRALVDAPFRSNVGPDGSEAEAFN